MTGTGATRRPRRPPHRRLGRSELALLVIPVALGVAVPILWQAPAGLTVAALLSAAVAGLGSSLLSGVPRIVAWIVVGIGGALAWGRLEPALALGWLMLFPCAAAVGGHLRAVRAGATAGTRRTEQRSVPGPAAEPRLIYDEDDDWVDVAAPSAAAVATAIEALDGEHRSVVSLFRGPARLDVGGDAGGVMMAYHCSDTAARPVRWSHLITPDAGDGEVAVRLAGDVGRFRRWQTTTLEPVRRAAADFLGSGGRAAGLAWRDGGEVAELRPPVLDHERPPG